MANFNASNRREYLRLLRGGMFRRAAAHAIDVPYRRVDAYIAEHDDYRLDVVEAEDTATEHVQTALYQAATSGNVQAARIWLEARRRAQTPRRPPTHGDDPAPTAPGGDDLEALMAEVGD